MCTGLTDVCDCWSIYQVSEVVRALTQFIRGLGSESRLRLAFSQTITHTSTQNDVHEFVIQKMPGLLLTL